MTVKAILIVSLIFFAAISVGQTNDLPERDPFKLSLAVSDTNFYNADIKSSPYILNKSIVQFYPGETVFVEIERDGQKIVTMKTVKENQNPEKTLVISLTQQTEGKSHKGMMLKVFNPFDKKLEYKANMFLMKYNKLH